MPGVPFRVSPGMKTPINRARSPKYWDTGHGSCGFPRGYQLEDAEGGGGLGVAAAEDGGFRGLQDQKVALMQQKMTRNIRQRRVERRGIIRQGGTHGDSKNT